MPSKLSKSPELAEYAKKMRSQGMGYRGIAQELFDRFDFKVSHMGVKTFFDNLGVEALGLRKMSVTKASMTAEEMRKEILDTKEQLKKINTEMWELYKEIKEEGKDKFGISRANMLDKILRQLEFNSRQLGRITSAAINITQINYVDFAVTISKYLDIWEKEGYIKILKRPIAKEQE